MKNPIQPLMKDANGVVRFKGNAIVRAAAAIGEEK